jgi:ubiquinone/menaquinone biosynthesis C-methylase UbiE/DNA-binding transcriptional ArsR family regulator
MSGVAPMVAWMQSLSDPTRVRLLRLLEKSELSVAEMCNTLQMPQSTVSRHLKMLSDDGWATARREGASNWYRMPTTQFPASQKKLWVVARGHCVPETTGEQDDARLERVLESRRSRSQNFFSSAAGKWDRLRGDLFGHRVDAWGIAAGWDSGSIVGDLGCGTGMISQTLAPWVEQVIAVDASMAMLNAARKRLKDAENVDLRRGELTDLPIDSRTLSASIMVLVMPYLADPQRVFEEVHRATKARGRLILVDMLPHDREEYRDELGHSWMGFSKEQVEQWLQTAGWALDRWTIIPPEADAKGTQTFAASAVRR